MGHLDAAARNRLPSSDFGLPKQREYPMEDRGHAIDAKARASEEESKGRITPGQEQQIDNRADRVIDHSKPSTEQSRADTRQQMHSGDVKRHA